jgi:SAM-dependent methyltransferase
MLTTTTAIRNAYQQYGVKPFYQQFGDSYRNPHELVIGKIIQAIHTTCQPDWTKVLDLACGSGEVTLALYALGYTNIIGMDPYTHLAYLKRTGTPAEQYGFEDIEQGRLADRHYTTIVCSFALHLVTSSRLPKLLYQLSRIAPALLIITPHKKPEIKPEWGWNLSDELLIERVRGRFYHSPYARPSPGALLTSEL